MLEYILSPEFVQLVEQHPHYFLALATFVLLAYFFVFAGLSLCIHSIARPSRATYHYHWPQGGATHEPGSHSTGTGATAQGGTEGAPKPWEQYASKRWQESILRPIRDPSIFRKYSRVPIPKEERFRILRRDKFRCQLCGRGPDEASLHVDHKVPVAAGGRNDDANLWTLCADCNLSKSDKIMEELFDDFVSRGGAAKKPKPVDDGLRPAKSAMAESEDLEELDDQAEDELSEDELVQ